VHERSQFDSSWGGIILSLIGARMAAMKTSVILPVCIAWAPFSHPPVPVRRADYGRNPGYS